MSLSVYLKEAMDKPVCLLALHACGYDTVQREEEAGL